MQVKLKSTQIPAIRKKILDEQLGLCAICGTVPQVECLDHRHPEGGNLHGYIRGVLCLKCNSSEGRVKSVLTRQGVKDQLQFLKGLVSYLEKHQSDQTNLLHPSHKTEAEKALLRKKRRVAKK